MKRILMRAGMSPLSNLSPLEVLTENTIGNNIGNMLFPYSISRTLTTEDTQIDTIRIGKGITDQEADMINKTYDCMVLPFANAFRSSFKQELRLMIRLIKKIKIPCIVVGVGAQAPLEDTMKDSELDMLVKRFVKLILRRSAMLGLRGEFTADYLKGLGFQAERDFTVIGCPSMFMWGDKLPEMKLQELTPDSRVSMNSKISLGGPFHKLMERSRKQFEDYTYVPQVIEEIYRMYVGMPYQKNFSKKRPKPFPVHFDHEIYRNDRAMSFINVPSWLSYLSQKDFSFGSRVHGNIAAILSGTPCFILVSDARIKELVDYHHIPHMLNTQINSSTSILDLYEKADYAALNRGHRERFMHYLDFLGANDLEHIYDSDGKAGHVYFDDKVKEIDFQQPLHAFSAISVEEQVERLEAFMGYYRDLTMELRRKKKAFIMEENGTTLMLGAAGMQKGSNGLAGLLHRAVDKYC